MKRHGIATYMYWGMATCILFVVSFYLPDPYSDWLRLAFGIMLGGLFVIVLLKILAKQRDKRKYLHSTLRDIDRMTGEEFEKYLYWHFKKDGYKVSLTPKTADYGADLVMEKKGVRTVVQVKRYRQKVGIEAVQQVIGAIRYYKADNAMVATNSYFTPNAKNLARVNGVTLWDRTTFLNIKKK